MRRTTASAFALVALVAAPRASADSAACVDAATEGQTLRDRGALVASRQRFIACAQPTCPEVVASACAGWLADVERRLPTVVFRSSDAGGKDVPDVHLVVDGKTVSGASAGRAVELDPGSHDVRFERPGQAPIEQRIVLVEGDKERLVFARWPEPKPAARQEQTATEERRVGLPWAFWPLAGASVLALGGGAFLGLSGAARADDLRASCGPRCPESDRQAVADKLLVADILIAAGVVTAAVAAVVALTAPARAPAPRVTATRR